MLFGLFEGLNCMFLRLGELIIESWISLGVVEHLVAFAFVRISVQPQYRPSMSSIVSDS